MMTDGYFDLAIKIIVLAICVLFLWHTYPQ